MDIILSQIALNQGLAFLAWASAIVIIVVAFFSVKLILDLRELAQNLNETSIILNTELKPTLKEINETLHSVNEIVKRTDKGVDNFKSAVEKTFGKTKIISESLFSGLIKGFTMVLNLFKKK